MLSARARLWRLSVLYRLFSLDEWRIKCIEEEEYDRAWRVLSTVLYMFYWTFFFHPGFVYGQGNRLSRVISKRRRIRTLARTISTGFRDETYCVVLLMDFLSKKKQKTYSTRLLSTMKSDINFQLGKWLSDWRQLPNWSLHQPMLNFNRIDILEIICKYRAIVLKWDVGEKILVTHHHLNRTELLQERQYLIHRNEHLK